MKSHWPGLVFWIGPWVFRTAGYFFLILAGVCAALRDPFWIFIVEASIGHLLICAAEAIREMNDERRR